MSLSSFEVNDLLQEIRSLKDRIEVLERNRNPVGNIPRGNTIQMLDKDGPIGVAGSIADTVARIGTSEDGTDDVVQLGNSGLALSWGSSHGLILPYEHVPAVNLTAGGVSVTSGTFASIYRFQLEYKQSTSVKVAVPITVPGGTNGEVKVTNSDGNTSSTFTVSVSATTQLHWMDIPANSPKLYSGPWTYEVQVRRSAGAGTVSVFEPTFTAGKYHLIDPTGVGTWT